MKGSAVGRKRRRHPPPLRVHVVDDHCDALSKIHGAIRAGALPFSGLSVLHFDAHPDLMVTPDMPADTCFHPEELYHTLATAEGGIAEWILPMVYQGHLSKLWWIRPTWARQFTDGDHCFCVGQVKATGKLRVSSTAPYFVDDRLYCPERDMQECKTLDLCVSLVPEQAPSSVEPQAAAEFPADSKLQGGPHRTPETGADAGTSDETKSKAERAHENGSAAETTRGGIAVGGSISAPATEQPGVSADDDARSTPWVLDICLDYFTTENPFIKELEEHIGKRDAATIRDFYGKPLFRGAATSLPHGTQLEHERIFKTEVDRLLQAGSSEHEGAGRAAQPGAELADENESLNTSRGSTRALPESNNSSDGPDAESKRDPGENVVGDSIALIRSEEVDHEDHRVAGGEALGLQRLAELFCPDGDDRLLVGEFASIVGRIGREGREKVAWTDHCACLPRYLANREEIGASVRKVEAFLRSLLLGGAAVTSSNIGGAGWRGQPGVITVARSEEDGYVPAEMLAFVEGEVLEMLNRLYGAGGYPRAGGKVGSCGLEVCYEDGLEHTAMD